jgi:hypothetical protein
MTYNYGGGNRPEINIVDMDGNMLNLKTSLETMRMAFEQFNLDNSLNSEKTGDLVDVNTLMVNSMAELITTIENWKIQMNATKSSGGNTDGLGT